MPAYQPYLLLYHRRVDLIPMKHQLRVSVLSLVMLLFWAISEISLADGRKTVLVIESYHSSYQWDKDYTRAIRDVLAEKADLEFFQLDTKRLAFAEHARRADQAWQTYLRIKPDLVILGDDNALKYLGQRFAGTRTPVIYLGINNNPRNYFSGLPKNITGVLERPLLRRSIVHMREIMADRLSRVLILFDDGTTARTLLKEEFQDGNLSSVGPVAVDIRLIGSLGEWRDAIVTAPEHGYDAIVVGLYHTITTADGRHVPEQEIITWSSDHATVPLFAFWKFAVGRHMTAGGLVLDAYVQGKMAATIAGRVLAGEPPPSLPQSSGDGQFVFSRSQLMRWQLNLPEDIFEQSIFLP